MHRTEPGEHGQAQRETSHRAGSPERQDGQPEVVPEWMRKGLHDLCQPLTAMECRLYLTQMDGQHSSAGPAVEAELRAAIQDAMTECRRMMHLLREMQERLHEAEAGGDSQIHEH